jgi:hypothetical protein
MHPFLMDVNNGLRAGKLEWLAYNSTIVAEKRTCPPGPNRAGDMSIFRINVIAPFKDDQAVLKEDMNGTSGIFGVQVAAEQPNKEICVQFGDKAFGGPPDTVNSIFEDAFGLARFLVLGPEVAYWFGGPGQPGWGFRNELGFSRLQRLLVLGLDFTHQRWRTASTRESTGHITRIIQTIREQLEAAGNPGLDKVVAVGLQCGTPGTFSRDLFMRPHHQWTADGVLNNPLRPDGRDVNWFRILAPLVKPDGGQVILGDRDRLYVGNVPARGIEPYWGQSTAHLQFDADPALRFMTTWCNPNAVPAMGWPQPGSWAEYMKQERW